MEDWEKEKQDLKKKPHLKLQKDVWVDFLVNPKVVFVAVIFVVQGLHFSWAPCVLPYFLQVLMANMRSLENKVKL